MKCANCPVKGMCIGEDLSEFCKLAESEVGRLHLIARSKVEEGWELPPQPEPVESVVVVADQVPMTISDCGCGGSTPEKRTKERAAMEARVEKERRKKGW